jgi:hypothetical protein
MRSLIVCMLSAFLVAGSATATMAQENKDKGVKEDVKDAGKATGRAAKKTGKAIGKGTKKVVHAGAKGTRKGAGKVEEKTAR